MTVAFRVLKPSQPPKRVVIHKEMSVLQIRKDVLNYVEGLPWRSSDWDFALPIQGPRFDPWSGNWIPHAAPKSLSPAAKVPSCCS